MLTMTATSQLLNDTLRPPARRPASETDIAAIDKIAHATPTVFAPREDLFLEGDEATHLLEVTDGVVCAYRLLADGHRHVVTFYFAGDLIGNCCARTHAFSAQALNKVRVRRIPRYLVNQLVETQPGFAQRMLKLAADELSMTREHMMCLAAKSADARIAAFLMELSRRNTTDDGDPKRLELPMTRIDIGDYLGLTIETVSRTFSKLKRLGVIALPRTTTVLIRDQQALAKLAHG